MAKRVELVSRVTVVRTHLDVWGKGHEISGSEGFRDLKVPVEKAASESEQVD